MPLPVDRLMATDCNSHRLCQFMLKIFEIPAYQHVGHSLTTYNHTLPATPHTLQKPPSSTYTSQILCAFLNTCDKIYVHVVKAKLVIKPHI